MNKITPVSYTHLDVYKRQGWEVWLVSSDIVELCGSGLDSELPGCPQAATDKRIHDAKTVESTFFMISSLTF